MNITTIRISKDTKKQLDNLKLIPDETYDNLLIRLLKLKKDDKK